jgi:hypothetical protein
MMRTTLLALLAAAAATLAAPGLAQAVNDPLLSGYGGPGAGEQVVIGSSFSDPGGGGGSGGSGSGSAAGDSGSGGGGSNQASGGSGGQGGGSSAGQPGGNAANAGGKQAGGGQANAGSSRLSDVPLLSGAGKPKESDDDAFTTLELVLAAGALLALILLVAGLRRLVRQKPDAGEAAPSH